MGSRWVGAGRSEAGGRAGRHAYARDLPSTRRSQAAGRKLDSWWRGGSGWPGVGDPGAGGVGRGRAAGGDRSRAGPGAGVLRLRPERPGTARRCRAGRGGDGPRRCRVPLVVAGGRAAAHQGRQLTGHAAGSPAGVGGRDLQGGRGAPGADRGPRQHACRVLPVRPGSPASGRPDVRLRQVPGHGRGSSDRRSPGVVAPGGAQLACTRSSRVLARAPDDQVARAQRVDRGAGQRLEPGRPGLCVAGPARRCVADRIGW